MRVIYLCPADDTPTGGIKVIYRHAELLASLGGNACVLHPFDPHFRCSWFAHRTRFTDSPALDPATDLVVIPELWAGGFAPQCAAQGVRYALFVQNGYLTHPVLPAHTPAVMRAAYEGAALILAISDDTARMVALNYPTADPARTLKVQYSVSPDFLRSAHPAGERTFVPKSDIITYMPRKMTPHADRVVFALRQHLPPHWSIQPIHNVDEAACAAMLRRSKIFLAFSEFEGLPLPPLEAALSGNLVIGYTGNGAAEYWRAPNFQEISQGDVQGFVQAARAAAGRFDAGALTPAGLEPVTRDLAVRYGADAERRNLETLLARTQACFARALAPV